MRAVVQRVKEAEVRIEDRCFNKIEKGLLVFLGVGERDSLEDANYIARKISNLRIFTDSEGRMNLSIKDVGGEILLVSQFTLYGDVRKGNRPSFDEAAGKEKGESLYKEVIKLLRNEGLVIKEGRFGAYMQVVLKNDGPVTILLDSRRRF